MNHKEVIGEVLGTNWDSRHLGGGAPAKGPQWARVQPQPPPQAIVAGRLPVRPRGNSATDLGVAATSSAICCNK